MGGGLGLGEQLPGQGRQAGWGDSTEAMHTMNRPHVQRGACPVTGIRVGVLARWEESCLKEKGRKRQKWLVGLSVVL